MTRRPVVSAVVPTHRRPELVAQAVASALGQTLEELEVVVVVDGGDGETRRVLERIGDERLRVLAPARRLGNGGARNAGIRAARGRWIALLDDDDLWMPEKLARQLDAAERSELRLPIVSSRFSARDGAREFLWPRRLPRPGEPLSEYLFCRRLPTTGEGMAQTSTIFAPAELFRREPFAERLRRFVDLDWLLRAARVEGAGLAFAAGGEPLSVWRIEPGRPRVTNESGWRWDVAWIRRRRHLVTPRAYAAFLLTLASARAAREGDRGALAFLAREALRGGRPGAAELAYHAGNFCVPRPLHDLLAGALSPSARSPRATSSVRWRAPRSGT